MRSTLEDNLRRVRQRIARAAAAAGRPAHAVELLPVTKSVSAEIAAELVDLGFEALAEARADALESKAAALEAAGRPVRWHFIGHLQRNKARRVVQRAAAIHSIDSARLLEAVERHARALDARPEVYLQVNLTGEEHKHGATGQDIEELVDAARRCTQARVVGLMAMSPREERPDRTAAGVFEEAATLARRLEGPDGRGLFAGGRCRLSMGMSGDLEQAIAAGCDLVRVGSALFEAPPSASPTSADHEAQQ